MYRSSTYVFSSPEAAERAFKIVLGKTRQDGQDAEDGPELIYARLNHPNAEILENQLVPLERGANAAAVYNSGMAAICTVLFGFMERGGSLLYTQPLYGGTQHLIHEIIEPLGFAARAVPAGNSKALADAAAQMDDLNLILVETPANPTLMMTDIKASAAAAQSHPKRPLLAVDNTLLGPTFQHPLAHGADLVIYSATKFLGGFSDLLAGAVLASEPEFIQSLRGVRALMGNILQADESWILDSRFIHRGVADESSEQECAKYHRNTSASYRAIKRVFYPSLFTDPEQIRIRDAQTDYPGCAALRPLRLKGGKPAAFEFLRQLKIAKNAVSLGGVETLACHPIDNDAYSDLHQPRKSLEQTSLTHSSGSQLALSTGAICWMSSHARSIIFEA